jgi:hypothetical protein
MQCSTCRHEAMIFQPYSGRYLCEDHLVLDLETKAKRAIRIHRGIQPGDHIAVVITGDSAGNALLFLLLKLTINRMDILVSPFIADTSRENRAISRDPGITKIALATTLEDAAASTLATILRGDIDVTAGHTTDNIPRITPFSHIPAEEIAVYARVCGVAGEPGTTGNENDPFLYDVKSMLTGYSGRHPAAPHAIMNLSKTIAVSCRYKGPGDGNGS